MRKTHPALRRPRFLHGHDHSADGLKDIVWLTPEGVEPDDAYWRDGLARCIGLLLNGQAGAYRSWDGRLDGRRPPVDRAERVPRHGRRSSCRSTRRRAAGAAWSTPRRRNARLRASTIRATRRSSSPAARSSCSRSSRQTGQPEATATGPGFAHALPFGAELRPDGMVRFRLWAPGQDRVALVLDEREQSLTMSRSEDGWFELVTAAAPGSRYRYQLDNGLRVADPAARAQQADVQGPSLVVDPNHYAWQNPAWAGRPWSETVLYELHVGTFSEEGTFEGAREKLAHLREARASARSS